MSAVYLVVPEGYHDPQRPSGGNRYDRRLAAALEYLGWSVRLRAVPCPRPSAGVGTALALTRVLAAIPDGQLVVVDGLVGSPSPEVLLPESDRLRLVALVHMPLGTMECRDVAEARARERAVLKGCAAVVVTSHWTRQWLLHHYRLPAGSVVVAQPGVDLAEPAEGSAAGSRLLCVAAVTPVKGHDVLVEALAAVRDLGWTCTCVGSTTIDPAFAREAAAAARRHNIADRVVFRGPLSSADLDRVYSAADVLVVPSRLETYGMVVGEALARGLPVIASDVGGVGEALDGHPPGQHDGVVGPGVLVTPGDPAALAFAVRHWLADPGWRGDLRRRALARRTRLAGWSTTAERVSEVLAAFAAATGAAVDRATGEPTAVRPAPLNSVATPPV